MPPRTVALLIGREPAHRYSVHRGYADAVWAAGAVPVILVPPPWVADADRYVEAALACDALCATGGGDIDPRRYGDDGVCAETHATRGFLRTPPLMDVDGSRDDAELAALRAAVAASKPVLGICRGIQALAVALGGRLHRDLPAAGFDGHWDEERQHEPVHDVIADPGTLAAVALAGAGAVNSIHHQAVRDPGPALVATAWAADGIIEAIEAPGLLGVQWHPERLDARDPRHLAPFTWLVAA